MLRPVNSTAGEDPKTLNRETTVEVVKADLQQFEIPEMGVASKHQQGEQSWSEGSRYARTQVYKKGSPVHH